MRLTLPIILLAVVFRSGLATAQDCNLEATATLTTALWGSEVAFTISDDNGVLVTGQNFEDNATYSSTFCVDDVTGCLVLEMTDSFGDGWNGATLQIDIPALGVPLGTFTLSEGDSEYITFGTDCGTVGEDAFGCTDPVATNFDPLATWDDGSCTYDCGCEDVEEPVCAFNSWTGELATFTNACEAACAGFEVLADGDCDNLPVPGCTDETALNYDPEASEDDGSCVEVPACGGDETAVLITLQTALWGDEVSFVLSDSTGVLAEGAGLDNYATTYAAFCRSDSAGCFELEMIDSFGDGWNGAIIEISLPELGVSLGTFSLESGQHQAISFGLGCETEVVEVEGCTDHLAFNFDPYATVDDGSCSYECECEDIYEPVCAYDYATGEYVTFNNACEAGCAQVYILWDGDCADMPVYGCTDEEALNYNPDATQDDGSCVVIPTCGGDETAVTIAITASDSTDGWDWGSSLSWNLTDDAGFHANLVYDYSDDQYATAYGCLTDGCYNFFVYDYGWSYGAEAVEVLLGEDTTAYAVPEGQYEAAFAIGVNTEGCEVFIPVYGCMDPEAMNYDPEANMDSGYCLYPCECEDVYEPVCGYDSFTGDYVTFNNPCEAECWNAWIVWDGDCADLPVYGCTDPNALNYNPDATEDDGSCAVIPVCEEGETEIVIQSVSSDSLNEFGWGTSLHWSLTTDLGQHINLVYDYDETQTTSYGCLEDGCYNFYLNDFGWNPGANSAEVLIGEETSTYAVPFGTYGEVFAVGVNAEGCEVTIPGCTDPEALNYYAEATVDDGSCTYPFVCEDGEVGHVYMYTSVADAALTIVSEAGEVVFVSQSEFGFGDIYGQVCLEAGVCYAAIVTGSLSDADWDDGVFGLSTLFEDIAYAEWPAGEDVWVIPFSIDGACSDIAWDAYYGCTDPEANNYDPDAVVDDGSCLVASACGGMFEVEFVLDGGMFPEEVALNVSNEEGELLMEMDGYTGSSVGCVPAGCYKVEMFDSFGDGWNGASAALFVDGEPAGSMTLTEGDYEMQYVGLGVDCETAADVDDATPAAWDLQLFPNPGTEVLTIRSAHSGSDGVPRIEVFNADGRRVEDRLDAALGSGGDWVVSTDAWPAGMYIVHITQDGVTRQLPWIKVR